MLAVWIIAAVLIFLLILSLIPINAVFTVSYSDGLEGMELFVKFLFIKIPVFPKAKKTDKKTPYCKRNTVIFLIKNYFYVRILVLDGFI